MPQHLRICIAYALQEPPSARTPCLVARADATPTFEHLTSNREIALYLGILVAAMLSCLIALCKQQNHGSFRRGEHARKHLPHSLLAVEDDLVGNACRRIGGQLGADILDALVRGVFLGIHNMVRIAPATRGRARGAPAPCRRGREQGNHTTVGILGLHGLEQGLKRELVVCVIDDCQHLAVRRRHELHAPRNANLARPARMES